MAERRNTYSVFTKPWKMPIPELGRFVHDMGFDGIELPVRPGFQVEPANAAKDLPVAARQLADCGVRICSVAATADEPMVEACGAAGVPVLRIMGKVGKEGYLASEATLIKDLELLVPSLDQAGVTVGIQNHCDRNIANAAGLRRVIERFDPRHVAAVWDPAHCALNGEMPELAIDLVWSHLCIVNLKNGCWVRANAPDADEAKWKKQWVSGRQGLSPWRDVATELKKRDYRGVVCLTAEYSEGIDVNRQIVEDFAFAQSLLEG